MNDAMEIKHSRREKRRLFLAVLIALFLNTLVELKFRDNGIELLPFSLVVMLVLAAAAWFHLNHQSIRVDDTGITYKRWFLSRRILWSEVSSYTADWKMGFDDFLFTSYGLHNLQGKIVLKNENGDRLLNLKVDFGSTEERNKLKTLIMPRLQSLAT